MKPQQHIILIYFALPFLWLFLGGINHIFPSFPFDKWAGLGFFTGSIIGLLIIRHHFVEKIEKGSDYFLLHIINARLKQTTEKIEIEGISEMEFLKKNYITRGYNQLRFEYFGKPRKIDLLGEEAIEFGKEMASDYS